MPNRAVVSSHQFDILLHCRAGPRGFRAQYQGLKTSATGCCFLQQAGTQGLFLKPSRPGLVAYSSLGQCFSRAKNTVKDTEQEHRGVPAASLYHSQRWSSPWVWKPPPRATPPAFREGLRPAPSVLGEPALYSLQGGTEAHTGFAPLCKINSLTGLSKEVRGFWPAQRSFPSLKEGVTSEGAVVE